MTLDDQYEPDLEVLYARTTIHHIEVYKRGNVVIRETGPWAPTIHSLLRHLENMGFPASRVVDTGFDEQGRETLRYIEGEFMQPGPWLMEGVTAVGQMVRDLHDATASFKSPPDALWGPWFGRGIGAPERVIGHCDVTPWNIVVRDGMPVALIDWDFCGPIDPIVELAQAAWLNAKLHSDDVAEAEGLPTLAVRAKQIRAIVDAYGLSAKQRRGFFERILEFVVFDTAEQADSAGVTHHTTDPMPLWGLAWRARTGAWLLRNRAALENSLA